MRRRVGVSFARGATVAVAIALGLGLSAQAPTSRRTWREYGGSPDNSHYSALTQITKANVSRLQVAWSYPTRDGVSYVFNPIVVDNVMYVLAKNSSLVALDAATGKEIWIHANLTGIAPRGINYWQSKDGTDRRLIFQRNNFLEEIDAKTGKSILTFGTDGAVNLKEGLIREAARVGRAMSSNPGKVFENLIILGSATGEGYLSTPGDLRAFDILTGKLVWSFHTIPMPGEFGYETWPKDAWQYIGGTNTWGEITLDPVRGIAYFPTGSPTYDYYGADRPGANLFGTSLVALDARTGKRLWHFQMVHHDLWDYDNTAAPQLTTIRRNGRTIDVVAQAGKTGWLYVFDRVTGEPIFPIEERPVPKSDVPGEQSWPTQPFVTGLPPFANQTLTADDINPYILTPAEREAWKVRLANARNLGMFTPPAVDLETVAIPGATGGANWGTTASNPTAGLVYISSANVPSIYKLTLDTGRGAGGGAAAQAAVVAQGRTVYMEKCQTCHGADQRGNGVIPSIVGVSARQTPDALRELISGGRLGMPSFNDLPPADVTAVIAFLSAPPPGAGRGVVAPPAPEGPVVATGGAPGARATGPAGRGAGNAYPAGLDVPSVRYTTGYGLMTTLVKPPYSTLTAYDLNKGIIKWQVPSGGDDPRAVAQGGKNTGVSNERSGMVVTATGLIFKASGDGTVAAYDAETGKVLWRTTLPTGSRGVPSMFEVGGRQYLAINAAYGGGAPTPGGSSDPKASPNGYVVFALPR